MAQKNNNQITLDSRKFIGSLNDSAQSNVAFFENKIKQLGHSQNKSWKLTALYPTHIYFEDTNANKYYSANYIKDRGKVTINNIKQLNIVENEKKELFNESCLKLVNAIEENDQKGMHSAFSTMKSHRFTSRVVPQSGYIKCRDNVLRKVNISDTILGEDRNKIISVIVESLSDRVIVENGVIQEAYLVNDEPIKFPLTKWASKKLVARKMQTTASNAYYSEGFRNRIAELSNLVAEGKIDAAVKFISPFLEEMEEFTLLTRNKVKTLIENTLAANGCFNQSLCNDVSKLFYLTNLKVNKTKIVKEWKNIARASEHMALVENVQKLSESNDFTNSYDKFLTLIFEAMSNRDVTAHALATTLESLRDKTPKIKESHDLSSKLSNLITRLKDQNFDDAAIYEAEDLIATIQEELTANETLSDFDNIPDVGGEDIGVDDSNELVDADGGEGAPVININSPLIQIGGTSSAANKDEDDLGDVSADFDLDDESGLGDDNDPLAASVDDSLDNSEIDNELGGVPGAQGTPAPAAPGVAKGPLPGDRNRLENRKKGKLLESRPVHYEMKDEDDDDMPENNENNEIEENYDPYAFKTKVNSSNLMDYGAPILSESDMYKAASIMKQLAAKHKLVGESLEANLVPMAKSSISAIGLRIPGSKLVRAIDQVVNCFNEEMTCTNDVADFPNSFIDKKKKEKEETADDTEDEVNESKSTKIKWIQEQDNAKLGVLGDVRFILDHGGSTSVKPVILSEDGNVTIPIPKHLYNSAYAAALMKSGNAEDFENWLGESIEQLRPMSDEENESLDDAVATITAGDDGSLNIDVSGGNVTVNTDIDEFDDIDTGIEGDDGLDDGLDDDSGLDDSGLDDVDNVNSFEPEFDDNVESDDEMKPVDSVSPVSDDNIDVVDDTSDETMPNFEDDGLVEDKDITTPKDSKYSAEVKGDLRKSPDVKPPKKNKGDKLEGVGPDVKTDDGTGTNPPTAK